MSFVSSFSSPMKDERVDQLISEIDEKTQKLEEIFSDIDVLQDENDSLQKKRSEIINAIQKLERENEKQREIKKALALERQSPLPGEVPIEILTDEHQQFIRSKEDEVLLLSQQFEEMQTKYQTQEEEYNLLLSENNDLELEKKRLDQESQRLVTSSKTLSQATNSKSTEISKQKNEIVSLNKDISDLQNNIQDIIEKMENSQLNVAEIAALQKEIDSLKNGNEECRMHIQDVQNQIEEFELNVQQEELEKGKIFQSKLRIIGWDSERKALTNELNEVTKQEKEVSQKLRETMDKNAFLRQRLNKLRPIHKKWNKKFKGKTVEPVDGEIDTMLKKCTSNNRKSDKKDKNVQLELQKVAEEIEKLEVKIAKSKENLYSAMLRFKSQEANKKQQISDMRNDAFEREHQMIEQIKALKIKTAGKQISNH